MKAIMVFVFLALMSLTEVAVAQWQVKEESNGDGTSDVRAFNAQGNPGTTIISNITEGTFALGPAFGSELIAAGVTDGISWTFTVVYFDPLLVPAGASRNTLYSIIAAHDPSVPAPPDEFVQGAADLANEANVLLLDPGNITNQQCIDFLTAYLAWYDLFP